MTSLPTYARQYIILLRTFDLRVHFDLQGKQAYVLTTVFPECAIKSSYTLDGKLAIELETQKLNVFS